MLYKRGILKNFSKFTDKHKKETSRGVLSRDTLKDFGNFTEKHLCRSLLFNKVAGWKPETVRSSRWRWSVKQGVLKNFTNFTGKNLCWTLFIILKNICERLLLKFISRETRTHVFSCEFRELFKSTYFVEDLQTAGSETPVRGFVFNKVASLTARRLLTVLERDCRTGISL